MTRRSDLQALRDAVKAGGVTNEHLPDSLVAVWQPIVDALNGSLDAAHALHKAVLPEADAEIRIFYDTQAGADVRRRGYDDEIFGDGNGCADTPARAWLLAILSALIAQEAE